MEAVTLELRTPDGSGRIGRALAAIPAPPLGALFAPIDLLRARLLRFVAPRWRALVVERDLRVAFVGTLLMITALVSTSLVPIWFIAVGPILWGIPHVVSDVRYLVMRPGYHRRPGVALATGAGIVAAGLGFGLRAGLAGAAGALVFARAPVRRRALGVGVIAALFALAAWVGPIADWFFVHAHNAVGVALWWAWRRRTGRMSWLPLALFAAFTALILAGGVDALVTRAGLFATWTGLSMKGLAYQLSPTMHGPWPTRFLVLYAFGQSAHYVVWMRLIPEDARPSPTPRSFQQSFRALEADVGALVLWAAVLGMIALAVWAAMSLGAARDGYIQLAFFHGYLELAAAALFWAEGKRVAG
jgi:hypothetical protein